MKNIYNIVIIGLGYVGLPLAIAFLKHYQVVGYNVNETRVPSLQRGIDCYLDVIVSIFDPYLSTDSCTNFISNSFDAKKKYDFIIVAVSYNKFVNYTTANFKQL